MSIFSIKRVARYKPKNGAIVRNVWVLAENGRDVAVDQSLAFVVRCIFAGRSGGAA